MLYRTNYEGLIFNLNSTQQHKSILNKVVEKLIVMIQNKKNNTWKRIARQVNYFNVHQHGGNMRE